MRILSYNIERCNLQKETYKSDSKRTSALDDVFRAKNKKSRNFLVEELILWSTVLNMFVCVSLGNLFLICFVCDFSDGTNYRKD